MSTTGFFESPEVQSRIKTILVSKYFGAWAKVMFSTSSRDPRIAYVDLFSGPGEYDDGTPSTPMLLLDMAIRDPRLSKNLVTMFNDRNSEYSSNLANLIASHPGIGSLAHYPEVWNLEMGRELVKLPEHVSTLPSLFFIDPWGYRGLSLELIGNAIRNWGCDCIFFFNYNRISPGINNPAVDHLMRELFGNNRLEQLRARLEDITRADERQSIIIDELTQALKSVGGNFVLPFEFQTGQGNRTSHYIIFVNKHFRGYSIMKDIMFKLSSDDHEVRRFEYVLPRASQLSLLPELFDPGDPYSIAVLKELVMRECAGQVLTVEQVYERHSVDTPYILRNFKKALNELEAEGRVTVSVPASDRRKRKGEVTLADHLTVTFPP